MKIKSLFLFCLLFATASILKAEGNGPEPESDEMPEDRPVIRRSTGPKKLSVVFENGLLQITTLREVGDVTILIIDEQTGEQEMFSASFPEVGSEWTLCLPDGQYTINLEGETISLSYQI